MLKLTNSIIHTSVSLYDLFLLPATIGIFSDGNELRLLCLNGFLELLSFLNVCLHSAY